MSLRNTLTASLRVEEQKLRVAFAEEPNCARRTL
jgi:hypothetical protein